MGAVEAGGTPMWHEPGAGARYFLIIGYIRFNEILMVRSLDFAYEQMYTILNR